MQTNQKENLTLTQGLKIYFISFVLIVVTSTVTMSLVGTIFALVTSLVKFETRNFNIIGFIAMMTAFWSAISAVLASFSVLWVFKKKAHLWNEKDWKKQTTKIGTAVAAILSLVSVTIMLAVEAGFDSQTLGVYLFYSIPAMICGATSGYVVGSYCHSEAKKPTLT